MLILRREMLLRLALCSRDGEDAKARPGPFWGLLASCSDFSPSMGRLGPAQSAKVKLRILALVLTYHYDCMLVPAKGELRLQTQLAAWSSYGGLKSTFGTHLCLAAQVSAFFPACPALGCSLGMSKFRCGAVQKKGKR